MEHQALAETPTILMIMDFVPDQDRTYEQFLLASVRQLREHGWRTVFAFAGEPSDRFARQLREADGKHVICEFPLHRESADRLIASLDGCSPRIMTTTFVSLFSPALLQLKKKLGIRYWLAHDGSGGDPSKKASAKRLLAKARGWYFGRHISSVLGVSEYIARRDVEQLYLPRRRVKVLYNAVDLERHRPAPEPADRTDDPLIAYAGRLIPEKGIRTLMEALVLLKQRPVPLAPRLELAGEGPQEEELRTFAKDHGLNGVRFLGQVSDVGALYRAATVVVVPSEIEEAFGLVVAEAMACGTCVLVSDAGGIPEVVGRDEEGGRIFRRGDAADLAEKLAALLEDHAARERFRKQGRARVERLFGLDRMVSGFVKEVLDLPNPK